MNSCHHLKLVLRFHKRDGRNMSSVGFFKRKLKDIGVLAFLIEVLLCWNKPRRRDCRSFLLCNLNSSPGLWKTASAKFPWIKTESWPWYRQQQMEGAQVLCRTALHSAFPKSNREEDGEDTYIRGEKDGEACCIQSWACPGEGITKDTRGGYTGCMYQQVCMGTCSLESCFAGGEE